MNTNRNHSTLLCTERDGVLANFSIAGVKGFPARLQSLFALMLWLANLPQRLTLLTVNTSMYECIYGDVQG